ncbi:hypothetical protein [Streptomyces sp. Wb2n-11]|uniref:hypothetical protein n=1 Tax=Streptomyces sp. Wb2n-11 TaxID=1030533 RepID=UPI000B107717|nr:hypothetical protein [Streptomyces sp. Wb2n-11]
MLADLITRHAAQAAQDIAHEIAAQPEQSTELITQLERIWRAERVDHDAADRIWLTALTHLTHDQRKDLYARAYSSQQYAAARCLAHHNL